MHRTVTILLGYYFRPFNQAIIRPIRCPDHYVKTQTKALYIYLKPRKRVRILYVLFS